MYENFGHLTSEIVSEPGADEKSWFAQYEVAPTGATAVVPIHMRNNPFMMANPTESMFGLTTPITWWENQSTTTKVAVGVGAAAVVGLGVWAVFFRK
jgi:hypothetical protein